MPQQEEVLLEAQAQWSTAHRFYRLYGKRAFDFCCAALLLLVLSPVLLIVAVCIKLADRGPVLYVQDRIGMGLKPFRIYKFRSMRVDADRIGGCQTQKNDARITPAGRFLRRTSLDELPQLFNVLNGSMSLVGYRPTVPALVHWDDPEHLQLFCIRPGITGKAQVYGRSNNTYEEAKQKNLSYLRDASWGLDLKLIFLTAVRVIAPSSNGN